MSSIKPTLLISLIAVFLMSACAPQPTPEPPPTATAVDLFAYATKVAGTVIVEVNLTGTASVPTATNTPAPTDTPEPTATPQFTPTASLIPTATEGPCDDYTLVTDVTYPDGTQVKPGEEFIKTWKVRNTGGCTWTTRYRLTFGWGTQMGGKSVYLPNEVKTGEEIDLSITLKAPTDPGTYTGVWVLYNNNGYRIGIGKELTVVIVVPAP